MKNKIKNFLSNPRLTPYLIGFVGVANIIAGWSIQNIIYSKIVLTTWAIFFVALFVISERGFYRLLDITKSSQDGWQRALDTIRLVELMIDDKLKYTGDKKNLVNKKGRSGVLKVDKAKRS
jgi:hypothetical protein